MFFPSFHFQRNIYTTVLYNYELIVWLVTLSIQGIYMAMQVCEKVSQNQLQFVLCMERFFLFSTEKIFFVFFWFGDILYRFTTLLPVLNCMRYAFQYLNLFYIDCLQYRIWLRVGFIKIKLSGRKFFYSFNFRIFGTSIDVDRVCTGVCMPVSNQSQAQFTDVCRHRFEMYYN